MPTCAHLDDTPLTPVPADFEPICTDCVAVGGYWVHLRRCLTCQQVVLLRLLPGQARHRPRPGDRTSGGHLGRAGGALALVLRGRVGA